MKERILLLTPPLAVALIAALVLSSGDRLTSDLPMGGAEEIAFSQRDRAELSLSAPVSAQDSKTAAYEPDGRPDLNVVEPRRAVVENLSGVALGKIPAGVTRVDAVLFESRHTAENGTIRRARVLKTDFHYPLLQTLEWLEVDPASGEETVVEYQTMVADQVMVQLDAKTVPATWREELAEYGLSVRREIAEDGLYAMSFEIESGDPVTSIVDTVTERFDWVEFAEPDFIVATRQSAPANDHIPNDPGLFSLWGLNNNGYEAQDIRAFDAWKIRREAPDVIVAVIDTGINYRHLDLKGNMWVNPRETRNSRDDSGNGIIDDIYGATFLNGTGYGDPMDYDGHGTHVAGTIGAIGNNGRGVVGVAWDVQLMAVKFLGSGGGGSTSDAIRSIDYAWQNGAHILNNSWGGDHYVRSMQGIPSRALERAIARSRDAGAIFVVAAGNDYRNVDILPDYPSYHQNRVDNVVNVGAMDSRGHNTSFSNYGATNVDVFAPGQGILSTFIGGDDSYASLDGTSMAAPHVSGMFALLKAEFPDEPYNVLIERLLQRSTQERHLASYSVLGRRANLAAALDAAPLIFEPLQDQELVPGTPVVFEVAVSGRGQKTYRWYKDGALLANQNSERLVIHNGGTSNIGRYRVEVMSPLGTTSSEAMLIEVPGLPEIGTALGTPYLAWSTSTGAPWTVSEEGVQSASIGDNMLSEISTVVTGPATISFRWNVSSETHYDVGRFLIGGEVKAQISGESGWLSRTHEIPAGTHKLVWQYVKDGSRTEGSDALQLREVVYNPSFPIIVNQSQSVEIAAGSSLDLSFEGIGAAPLVLHWLKDGKVVGIAGNNVLPLIDANHDHEGTYVGVASNSHGSVQTQPITITVVDEARPAEFSRQPQSYVGLAGDPVLLSASWTATYPYEARWFKDGSPLDIIGPVLSISNPVEENSGVYVLKVTNAAGTVESFSANVRIHPAEIGFDEWYSSADGSVDESTALLRFALGAESPDAALPELPSFALVGEPTVGTATSGQTEELKESPLYAALRFSLPLNAAGLRYAMEVSDDLHEWKETEASLEFLGEPDGVLQRVQLRAVAPLAEEKGRQFHRLRILLEE